MIQLERVFKRYAEHEALRGLTIKVNAGEVYGLLGPNGAGKSTTIRILLGFEPFDRGEVYVAGHDVRNQANEARALTAYIPENVELYPFLNGLENIDHFARLGGRILRRSELQEVLLRCGLQAPHHGKRLSTYSKGMRQKVGIAIALARQAQVLLLDEPASGLDPAASKELGVLLRDLAGAGRTVLMASHDLFRVRETCDRVGILQQGVIAKEMEAAAIDTAGLERAYLEHINS